MRQYPPPSILTKGGCWAVRFAFLFMGTVSLSSPTAPPHTPPPGGKGGATEKAPAGKTAADPPISLIAAYDLFMQGRYERAAEMYESLSAAPPTPPLGGEGGAVTAALGLARCRERIGKYEEAVSGLRKLDATTNAEWQFLLARMLRLKGRYADAMSHSRAAIRIDANHAAARLLLAETLELKGHRDKAIDAYKWFDLQLVEQFDLPKDAAWVTATAIGFVRFSVLTENNVTRRIKHALHEMLQQAYLRLDRSFWPARIAAADLLRARFNNNEEDGSVADYRAALRINPNLPEAYVGLGEVLLEGFNFEDVEGLVASAQKINPNHPGAFHLLAKKYLRERRYEQAAEACEQALAVNPHDLTALALRAASFACRYDDAAVDRIRLRTAEINPNGALLHRTLGDALAGIRQYAESEREYLAAIDAEPSNANARTELGMMYMQWGQEDRARQVLEGAWALDEFNQRTKFTLDLLESLDSFSRHETEHFLVKYDQQQDPGLGAYLSDCLEQIYTEVSADFDVTLHEKTIIEVFPTKRAFAVRITGKPWIHTVGACTGRVIALTSPRHSPKLPGPYRIAQVLKHEFTHTVTLAATNNRIPHWFTEGLAVLQENAPRTFDWTRLLVDAARRNRLFTLESINWGFIRPQLPTDRTLAYAQSEWMCEYLIERFGYQVIDLMLRQFRAGETQEAVFRDHVGLDTAGFDSGFQQWAGQQIAEWGSIRHTPLQTGIDLQGDPPSPPLVRGDAGGYGMTCLETSPPEDIDELRSLALAKEDSAQVWGRLARAEYDAGMEERALAAARRALELDESQTNGLAIAAEVLLEYSRHQEQETAIRAYENEALPLLKRLADVQPDHWLAARGMAQIALRRKERDQALEQLRRLQRLCPMDPLSWRGLAGLYLEQEAYDLALPQLLELARTNSTDQGIPRQIATISKRKNRLREARYWLQRAVYIAPFDVDLHEDLAEIDTSLGDWAGAIREHKMLMNLQPSSAGHYENAALAAAELGDSDAALQFARRALQLDPTLTGVTE